MSDLPPMPSALVKFAQRGLTAPKQIAQGAKNIFEMNKQFISDAFDPRKQNIYTKFQEAQNDPNVQEVNRLGSQGVRMRDMPKEVTLGATKAQMPMIMGLALDVAEPVAPTRNVSQGGLGDTKIYSSTKTMPGTIDKVEFIDSNLIAKKIDRATPGGTRKMADLKMPKYWAKGEMDRAQINAYKNMLLEGDKIDPIVITPHNEVLDGAHRLVALEELGYKGKIDVVVQDYFSPSILRKLNL